MTFVPNHAYLRPRPVEVPPGEAFVSPTTTVHVARDPHGREVGYLIEDGVGAQHPRGVDR